MDCIIQMTAISMNIGTHWLQKKFPNQFRVSASPLFIQNIES